MHINALEHRGGDYAGGNTHIMGLEPRISIFLESENWSSDGIWETSVKPLISIKPSARGLQLKKTKKQVCFRGHIHHNAEISHVKAHV